MRTSRGGPENLGRRRVPLIPGSHHVPLREKNRLEENHHIKSVVLFEENSILPLPECLESSGVEFLKLIDNQ